MKAKSSDSQYAAGDLMQGLRSVGIGQGDTVFFHVSLDGLGQAKDCPTMEDVHGLLLDSLREAVGKEGTLLVPTYTFSFCKQEVFDVQNTPTPGGPWSTSAGFLEFFRGLPGVVRSRDPIHSVAGLGPRAKELLNDHPNTCFGKDSVHERLMKVGGKICTVGVGLHEATFRHYAEEIVGVPFRFKKLFTGQIRDNGKMYKQGWVYNVRIMADNGYPAGERLEQKARETGKSRVVCVGRGEISAISTKDLYDLTLAELAKDPWFTAKGPAGDPVEIENTRDGSRRFKVDIPAHASMEQMITALWKLPRDIVSDGYDAALHALAGQLPMTIHEYPSGLECWSWIVPEKWTCHEAYLETLDGKRIFSYADCVLHVVSYSLPFEGEVTREELFKHLHVHPLIREAVPFVFKYYERDWGLCCSKQMKDSLLEDRYRVVINTSFSYSTLKVGEVVVPGETTESIVLCAHLCHPGMVNDDLTGVVVGTRVMQELLKRKRLRYTYRFLIVPETIGSVVYLSQNEDLIPGMKGGLFLEMLGRDIPHALQLSFHGSTEMDLCCLLALKEGDPTGWTGLYRTIIGNDERQFNGPGVRVPMLSLSRVLHASHPESPYREYHSTHDTPALVPEQKLVESLDFVLRMIDTLENNRVPVNNYKGEAFCSRFGLHIDWYTNPEGAKSLFDIMDRIDGTRSIAEIAKECNISFDATLRIVKELHRLELVRFL